ncbi:MAG: SDR family oxidoreductase [Spartobacteria bacterium]|nr:SDR family oxidoreductase [Spartobacteria bacterium]
MKNNGLEGKKVIVTGGASGIGRAVVENLLDQGAEVIAVHLNENKNCDALKAHPNCKVVVLNVTDETAICSFAASLSNIWGLVNNAGISLLEPFTEFKSDSMRKVFEVNVIGTAVMSREVAKIMIRDGIRGRIVNVSSQGSLVALFDHASYCSSKGAVDSLTQVMALELGQHGIQVNAINPTITMTEMGKMAWGDPAKSDPMLKQIPLGCFAQPEDLAHAVAFLLSENTKMITGACLPIDGGYTIQ